MFTLCYSMLILVCLVNDNHFIASDLIDVFRFMLIC